MDHDIAAGEELDVPADFGSGFARALGDGADLAMVRREERQQPVGFAEIAAAEDDGLRAELAWRFGHGTMLAWRRLG